MTQTLRRSVPANCPSGRPPQRAGILLAGALACLVAGCGALGIEPPSLARNSFASDWQAHGDRTWLGARHWANRLQDWRIADGAAECVETRPRFGMRTLHLLTHRLVERDEGSFRATVRIDAPAGDRAGSAAGLLIGAGGEAIDYRLTSQVHGTAAEDGGWVALVEADGRVRVRDFSTPVGGQGGQWTMKTGHDLSSYAEIPGVVGAGEGWGSAGPRAIDLEVIGAAYDGRRTLTIRSRDAATGALLASLQVGEVPADILEGAVALVSHRGPEDATEGYRFTDWRLDGELVAVDESRAFGPIAFVHYTVDERADGTGARLSLTAQSVPLGESDARTALLELADERGRFKPAASAVFDAPSATFHFAVEGVDPDQETPFRVRYVPLDGDGEPDTTGTFDYHGKVAATPADGDMTIALLSCQKSFTGGLKWNENGLWFPHAEVRDHVAAHEPDLLYFAGDQIYEGDLTPAIRVPEEDAILDYLHKWYRHGWSFGELTRRLPAVVVTDDHDVYHGNIWGNEGVRMEAEGVSRQDRGGYVMEPSFVNTVHRTQVAHLPPPADPSPLGVGITRYHTTLRWGGGSFAILADRMDKSPPAVLVPDGEVKNGWFQKEGFDPAEEADVPGARLLGKSQLAMLDEWGDDWGGDVWFKACLSQSPFANVATIPMDAKSGSVIPSLKVPMPGEYILGDKRAADTDSNGWPQSGRNEAVRRLRRAGAFHLTGDQHLGSTLRYGVDEFDDAGFVLSSPAVANTWPRRWYPNPDDRAPGGGIGPDAPLYTGRYLDGFGNRMTVHGIANPSQNGVEPARLHSRAPGYGIARVNRAARTVTLEAWERHMDPSGSGATPYPGWPVVVSLDDGDGRTPAGWLPDIGWDGRAVVQVVREAAGDRPAETVWTRAIDVEGRWSPAVFDADASYTLRMGPDGPAEDGAWPFERTGLRPTPERGVALFEIDLR